MRKLILVLSIVLVLGMVLAVACGPAAPAPTATVTVTKTAPPVTVTAAPVTVTVTPTPAPPKLVKVRDANITGGTGVFFVKVGVEKGFFKERGIDYEPIEMALAAARMAPFVGHAEITAGEPLVFYPERKDVRIIGPHMNVHGSVLVRKDSPYQSYHDLKGKKVGSLTLTTGVSWAARVMTKLEGLDLEKDFQLIIGEAPVQIGWLLKGEVEAIHIFQPLTSKLLVSDGDKVRELHWLNDIFKKHTGKTWPLSTVYTSEEWVKKNTDLARQIGLAFDDTLSYIYAHDEVWKSKLAQEFWKIDDPRVLELLVQRMPGTVERPRYGPSFKETFVTRARFAADVGLVPREAVDWVKDIILFAEPWR